MLSVDALSDYLTWLDPEAIARQEKQAEWWFVYDKRSVLNERHLRTVFARIFRKAKLPHSKPYDFPIPLPRYCCLRRCCWSTYLNS